MTMVSMVIGPYDTATEVCSEQGIVERDGDSPV